MYEYVEHRKCYSRANVGLQDCAICMAIGAPDMSCMCNVFWLTLS